MTSSNKNKTILPPKAHFRFHPPSRAAKPLVLVQVAVGRMTWARWKGWRRVEATGNSWHTWRWRLGLGTGTGTSSGFGRLEEGRSQLANDSKHLWHVPSCFKGAWHWSISIFFAMPCEVPRRACCAVPCGSALMVLGGVKNQAPKTSFFALGDWWALAIDPKWSRDEEPVGKVSFGRLW